MTNDFRLVAGMMMVLAGGSSGLCQSAEERFAARMTAYLDPTVRFEPIGVASGPKSRVGPAALEHPEMALVRLDVLPPAIPKTSGRPLRPRVSPEPAPLRHYFVAAQTPQSPVLPAGRPVRQPSVDVQVPPPLPILGTYVADRVSVADPSLDPSVQATLTPQTPARTSAVPFSPWNLPDPFEHAQTIRLTQPWPENGQPPILIVAPTRR